MSVTSPAWPPGLWGSPQMSPPHSQALPTQMLSKPPMRPHFTSANAAAIARAVAAATTSAVLSSATTRARLSLKSKRFESGSQAGNPVFRLLQTHCSRPQHVHTAGRPSRFCGSTNSGVLAATVEVDLGAKRLRRPVARAASGLVGLLDDAPRSDAIDPNLAYADVAVHATDSGLALASGTCYKLKFGGVSGLFDSM
eukprot:CAMPEP_0119385112 /NCGR_PEP_ID=MMETSP1334-20130426/89465_1 /TAXON_ID=127549 /ORGANISM="Calcidiscus leptoporus, Strain RCC1130" /LENGTH=196 /DNA_ID=CAMNT_0007406321 /DNA_START=139 /DNA_END=730 /DNA_ORIENTATION=-